MSYLFSLISVCVSCLSVCMHAFIDSSVNSGGYDRLNYYKHSLALLYIHVVVTLGWTNHACMHHACAIFFELYVYGCAKCLHTFPMIILWTLDTNLHFSYLNFFFLNNKKRTSFRYIICVTGFSIFQSTRR